MPNRQTNLLVLSVLVHFYINFYTHTIAHANLEVMQYCKSVMIAAVQVKRVKDPFKIKLDFFVMLAHVKYLL